MRDLRPFLVVSGSVLAIAACSSDKATGTQTGGQQSTPTVLALASIRFSPPSITVPVNSSVTWQFEGTAHNVTFRVATGAPDDIPGANANTSVSRTFNTPGVFAYDCTLHPGMSGSITVGQAPTQPPPQPPPGGYP